MLKVNYSQPFNQNVYITMHKCVVCKTLFHAYCTWCQMIPCNGWLFLNFDDPCKCLKMGSILILGKKENFSRHELILLMRMTVMADPRCLQRGLEALLVCIVTLPVALSCPTGRGRVLVTIWSFVVFCVLLCLDLCGQTIGFISL